MSRLASASCAVAVVGMVACGIDSVASGPSAIPRGAPGTSGGPGTDTNTSIGDGGSVEPAAQLSLALLVPAATVDLEAEGTLGWVHWGRTKGDVNSLNEKATARGAIPTFTLVGSTDTQTYGDNLSTFQWSNGAPTPTESGTRNGVFGKGKPTFTLRRAAGTTPTRLVVYGGVFKAKGRFTVALGVGAEPAPVRAEIDNQDHGYGRFVIDYLASDAASELVITWELVSAYDKDNSNVTLAAATLMPRP